MSHNTSHGWIKLHRSLLEHPLWLNSTNEQRVILVTLLMLANHAEKKWEWQGRPYTCKPGQLITSQESLRKKCSRRISRRQIQIALKRFEDMNFIVTKACSHNTLITICNWERYQQDNNADVQPAFNERSTDVQHAYTNKNDKECKNDKEPPLPPKGGSGGRFSSKGKQGLTKEALRVWKISTEIANELQERDRLSQQRNTAALAEVAAD
jgi:hypothetical protein